MGGRGRVVAAGRAGLVGRQQAGHAGLGGQVALGRAGPAEGVRLRLGRAPALHAVVGVVAGLGVHAERRAVGIGVALDALARRGRGVAGLAGAGVAVVVGGAAHLAHVRVAEGAAAHRLPAVAVDVAGDADAAAAGSGRARRGIGIADWIALVAAAVRTKNTLRAALQAGVADEACVAL